MTKENDLMTPDQLLDEAKGKLTGALLLGVTKDGEVFTTTTQKNIGDNLLLLEIARERLIKALDTPQ